MKIRPLILPLLAIVAGVALLAAYARAGGNDYVPQRPADPCRAGLGPRIPPRLEPLAERVVLVGLDEAACQLGVSRERLVLALPERRAEGEERALRAGLRRAVIRLDRAGRLPRTSALAPEVLDEANLPGPLASLAGRIPDSTIDSLLPAGPLLRRVVDRLDIGALLNGADPQSALRDTVEDAARDEVGQRLRARLPGFLGGGD